MRITIKELRRIIKEEVENVTSEAVGDMLDPELDDQLAADFDAQPSLAEAKRRRIQEMDATTVVALGAGGGLAAVGLINYAPKLWRSLVNKLTDLRHEGRYKRGLEIENKNRQAAMEALNGDADLNKMMQEYKMTGDRGLSKAISGKITSILNTHQVSLSTQEARTALRTGEFPMASPLKDYTRHLS